MKKVNGLSLLVGVVALLAVAPLPAATLCVNPEGSEGCYSSIQAAVTASVSNDTILVYPGEYYENVTLNKASLTLMGYGGPCSVKILADTGAAVTFAAAAVNSVLNGVLVEAPFSFGIYCYANGNMYISNCIVRYCGADGICCAANSGISFIWNNVVCENTYDGIYIHDGRAWLYSNVVMSNRAYGIRRYYESIVCEYNNVWNNKTADYGGSITHTLDINVDPLFQDGTCYRLQTGSPCIDTGRVGSSYLDCDGTRNDMGVYGGPDAWCGPGPMVTNLQLVPSTVVSGDTFEIQATGAAR